MNEQQFWDKIERGCEWYSSHPECFQFNYETFMIDIINDSKIPDEALFYVEYCNKKQESDDKRERMLKGMGLGER